MYALCEICGNVRRENVNECIVCILMDENLFLRKGLNEFHDRMNESEKDREIENLKGEVEKLNKIVHEFRNEGSVRNKVRPDQVGIKGLGREADQERGSLTGEDRTAADWRVVSNGENRIRLLRESQPVVCSNRFGALSEREGAETSTGGTEPSKGKYEALLVGDSQIKYLDRSFSNRKGKKRMRVCYPGARVKDVRDRLARDINCTNEDANVIVHVGTNDIGYRRSEELIEHYRELIQILKSSRRKCCLTGILPRLGTGDEWKSRALGINNRIQSICRDENVDFLDLWIEFSSKDLFARDGVHLSQKGVNLFSASLETYLSEN